jgi:subfamily B ATP-binding cassette protein MsbA
VTGVQTCALPISPFENLSFEGVTFSYPGTKEPALRDINLEIRAGERVALVGQSGSGKTTLAHLIPRFHDCQTGILKLNGRPVREYSLKSLRTNIGIVSQDPFLFNLSIRDNIAYGSLDANQHQVEQAATAAYAHEFIQQMPEGYDTVVGEKGVKLSGGQKQRLTIARAIMKNPSLLILDEATSALDTESERIVQHALENLMQGRTSLIIAHRLSTIINADRIVVMEKGNILNIGTHNELIQKCKAYKKLYRIQFDNESSKQND